MNKHLRKTQILCPQHWLMDDLKITSQDALKQLLKRTESKLKRKKTTSNVDDHLSKLSAVE